MDVSHFRRVVSPFIELIELLAYFPWLFFCHNDILKFSCLYMEFDSNFYHFVDSGL